MSRIAVAQVGDKVDSKQDGRFSALEELAAS